jgi:nucleotide-binding universal stress UspA family protein
VVPVLRYLVVANQTLGGDELETAIRDHVATGPCHFHVLVPATAASDLDAAYLAGMAETARHGGGQGGEGLDRQQARQLLEDELEEAGHTESGEDLGRRLARERLKGALAHLRELGAEVSGEVGVADPVDAIRVVLHRWEFDAIILSTLPGRRSRWLAMDLPTRIRRSFKLPVTVVTGPSSPPA